MIASVGRGTKVQVPRETKSSTSESITTFHASTCATSTRNRGIDSEAIERAKALKEEIVDNKKQSEKWDVKYRRVFACEGQWKGEDHLEGCEEGRLEMTSSEWRRGTTYLYSKKRKHVKPKRNKEKERREEVEESEPMGGDQEKP